MNPHYLYDMIVYIFLYVHDVQILITISNFNYHCNLFEDCAHRVHCTTCTMPSAAERYTFAAIENGGQAFIDEMQKLCRVYDVAAVKHDILLKTSNNDVLSAHLLRALELIERQHMFVINQRVHISAYKFDIIQLQIDLIDAQKNQLKGLRKM